jgi:predicted Zn-dependent peptidase
MLPNQVEFRTRTSPDKGPEICKERKNRSSFGRLLLGGLLFLLLAAPLQGQEVRVMETFLSNGMKLLMLPREGEPSFSGGWVAQVGSVNEHPGITGMAHLFEHMMFKGTPTIGTKDFQRDLEIMKEKDRLRELMREEEKKMRRAFRRGEIDDLYALENKTPRYIELDREFRELIAEQRQTLVANEFDRIYSTEGASGMNAFTSHDLTGYFITVPSNKLELWMWMESERLLRPVFREFYAEREVVMEERRLRVEATPLGRFEENFEAMFWQAHPYHWPVIGWASDILSISRKESNEFFEIYYAPQNITLILVGDFDPAQAEPLAERYFGRIAPGTRQVPDVVTLEPEQPAEKRMYAEADTNPQVEIRWHSVPFAHRDSYALQVLGQLLTGRTGRLHRQLVLENEVATDVYAYQQSRKYAGFFTVGGEAREGVTPQEVEKAIYAELEKLQEELAADEELEKVKNNYAAHEYRRLSANMPILIQLILYEGWGDWREINEAGGKIQAVTVQDVQRVAREYFKREKRAVAIYTRKPAAPADVSDTNKDSVVQ